VIGLAFAIPMGYALSRFRFPGHVLVDSIVDLPIILPPLLVGLSLLVFFQTRSGRFIEETGLRFVFQQKGIILCQLLASASFGIRAVKLTFDGIDPRLEHVAMTLGSTRSGAFFRVALPLARRGIITGAILIWTRAFGIFGPLMVFVGAVRMRTEVLPTTIYLEQSVGRIEVALAVAVLMLVLATAGLLGIRMIGLRAAE
jgi:molybdate transport system permease protein